MKIFLKASIFFVVATLIFPSWIGPSSVDKKDILLEKIVLHRDVRNFWGIKEAETYRGDKKFYTKYEIIYSASNGVWTKYIEPKKYSGREVIRKGQNIYSKTKGADEFTIEKRRYPSVYFIITKENLKLLRENYEIVLLENENVAGRECDVFKIISKSCEKPEMKIWADIKTGQILKYEKNLRDKNILSYWFKEIKINTKIDASIFSLNINEPAGNKPRDIKYYYSIEPIEKELDFPLIKSENILFGYNFFRGQIISRDDGTKIVHLSYTDGLNNISVFIRKPKNLNEYLKRHDEGEIYTKSKRERTVISKLENGIHINLTGGLHKKNMMQIFFSLSTEDK